MSESRTRSWALLALFGGQVLLGLLVGFSWLAWSPRTVAFLVPDGSGRPIVIPDESEAQMAGDGRFLVLSVIAGLLIGVVAWRIRRIRGPWTLALLVLGGLVSSLIARAVGTALAPGSNAGALHAAIHPPLTLHSTPILCVQGFVAVLVYTSMAGLSSDPTLGVAADEPMADPLSAPPAEEASPNPTSI
jgi:hypothetical protein